MARWRKPALYIPFHIISILFPIVTVSAALPRNILPCQLNAFLQKHVRFIHIYIKMINKNTKKIGNYTSKSSDLRAGADSSAARLVPRRFGRNDGARQTGNGRKGSSFRAERSGVEESAATPSCPAQTVCVWEQIPPLRGSCSTIPPSGVRGLPLRGSCLAAPVGMTGQPIPNFII
jgi:hypothetical protein